MGGSAAVLELFACENKALVIGMSTSFIPNHYLEVFNGVGGLYLNIKKFTPARLYIYCNFLPRNLLSDDHHRMLKLLKLRLEPKSYFAIILDVVVGQSAAVLKLSALTELEVLLVLGNTLLGLDF